MRQRHAPSGHHNQWLHCLPAPHLSVESYPSRAVSLHISIRLFASGTTPLLPICQLTGRTTEKPAVTVSTSISRPAGGLMHQSAVRCKPTGLWGAAELSEGKAKRMCRKRQQQPPLALTAEGLCNHQVGQGECHQTEEGSQSCAEDGWMGQGILESSVCRATQASRAAAHAGAAACTLPTTDLHRLLPHASPLEEVQMMSRKVKKGPGSRVKLHACVAPET